MKTFRVIFERVHFYEIDVDYPYPFHPDSIEARADELIDWDEPNHIYTNAVEIYELYDPTENEEEK